MSWIIPSLIPTNTMWENIISKKTRSNDQWVGPAEAIIGLAYKRFRPGAKLKIDSFRITNDHSHSICWGEYNFDWQSVKRTIFGGSAADMYNLKNPVFHSFILLNLLPQEKKELLLELSLQSIDNMMRETYSNDQVAVECLHKIKQIIIASINDEDLSAYQNQLNISQDYLKNPLTIRNLELWRNHLPWLEGICDQLQIAYDKNKRGEDFEGNLKNVKLTLENIRNEMDSFYQDIVQGK